MWQGDGSEELCPLLGGGSPLGTTARLDGDQDDDRDDDGLRSLANLNDDTPDHAAASGWPGRRSDWWLPREIIVQIASHLTRPRHVYHVALCSRMTWALLESLLYRFEVAFELTCERHIPPKYSQWRHKDTVLMWAVRKGFIPTVVRALYAINQTGPEADVLLDNVHRSYIHFRGRLQRETLDAQSQPPLIVAAREGQLDIVSLLLDAGADPDIAHQHPGQRPISHGGAHRNCETNLFPMEGCMTPLYAALLAGHEDVANLLIQHGAAVTPAMLRFSAAEKNLAAEAWMRKHWDESGGGGG